MEDAELPRRRPRGSNSAARDRNAFLTKPPALPQGNLGGEGAICSDDSPPWQVGESVESANHGPGTARLSRSKGNLRVGKKSAARNRPDDSRDLAFELAQRSRGSGHFALRAKLA